MYFLKDLEMYDHNLNIIINQKINHFVLRHLELQ
jgi:hypothetical protein